MANKPKPRDDDWFEALDAELEKEASSIKNDVAEVNRAKREINMMALQDMWKIWLRFNRSNIHFSIQPEYSDFLRFKEFPEDWSIREDFRFHTLNSIELTDRIGNFDVPSFGNREVLKWESQEIAVFRLN